MNYLLSWPCGCCDDWKDSSESCVVLRNGQRICQSCYDRKYKNQKQSARRRRSNIPVSPQTVTETVPY
ncbi:MAG: hypothetical protein JGK17_01030 [Microcoleus sp. PH2017_10_PVI_O_A]|uniref:hypothetical protein n=1 Tax=unclassified Microcoleus TaxID=2642155 RepID=UPI001D1FD400|nr:MULTISPECIES: hypothetical protein [unclassified Microcoleus]MCC3404203.1 hypothetical protein [Microcoleus sp. PH2017_10_PVI_O_A]MCC3458290.1 hypothetical protein [Microcoleus sp. PH2017_11_PCY_U_A]MCC3478361.1 hypothetical protein [Microcoleus sp. PH2017_12_PCY_D_A]MCC3527235.1 hypothetical protein [Microcoleus sp. PH2017_21_RUC_O_A]MCC3539408.1 hypothetical protein [Microcoleus sp. PH2017_22_RUC_O_B]